MGPTLRPAAGSEEQKGGMEGTSLPWLCLLTVSGVGPAFSYSCFWASSSCPMGDSKCRVACLPHRQHCMSDEGWNPAQHSSRASTWPQAAVQTRDISAWPLGVAQASKSTQTLCDRTTDADASPRGTMSWDVATASSVQHRPLRSDCSTVFRHPHGLRWQPRPFTSRWPLVAAH